MKPLSAVALFALVSSSTAVWAQSNVTIYGLIDLGVNKGNGGTATNGGANGTNKAWIMKSATASRLGFRGSEDLGGGLSAQFHIEHRFTPDDGVASTPFWTARSTVSLTSTTFGSIYMGREYIPAFWPALKTDPFGFNGVGQVTGFAGYGGTAGLRTNNTAGYRSPSIGGLKVQAAHSFGEGAAGRDDGLLVEYVAGPVYVGTAFDKITGASDSTNGNSIVSIGVSYDLQFVKPMAYYAHGKTALNGVNSNTYFTIGATAPMGAGILKAAFARYNPAGASNTRKKFAVGFDYFLSKRTNLYADVSTVREQAKTNNTAYSLGVVHAF